MDEVPAAVGVTVDKSIKLGYALGIGKERID
jgi:hypothetical protein